MLNQNELQRIADQLTRAVEGNAWHGPALLELLEDMTVEATLNKPFGTIHSIWEIVRHITAWHNAGIRRINGDPANLSDEEDWPLVTDISEETWLKNINELKESYRTLKYEILNFPLDNLDVKVLQLEQTYYSLFHGIIQHDLYHAGQIAIIKKSEFQKRKLT